MLARKELRRRIAREMKGVLGPTRKLLATANNMRKILSTKRLIKEDMEKSKLVVAFMFAEAYALFTSVKQLCEQGMSHTASIVLRSMIELVIYLKYLRQEDNEERAERFFYWAHKEKYKFMNKFPSYFSDTQKKAIKNSYESVKRLYVMTDRRGNSTPARHWHCFRSIEKLAESVDLVSEYGAYGHLSMNVHISPAHLLGRIRNLRIEYDPFFDPGMLRENLVMNFTYFLCVCRETNDIYSLGKSEVLDKFVEQQNHFRRGWENLGDGA
ncbi:hypothetical protein E3J62_09005 [candidate division TA06 bacterium]|uniref:Uncharacterized protein n=1 Tax=candidate division TA06 bacterium TaxID=2250710 RepID=A0A523UQY8_UNCT6|nr:MAG: hypothetical protein E3J62_09005 [candidate division TA06 bacterium]